MVIIGHSWWASLAELGLALSTIFHYFKTKGTQKLLVHGQMIPVSFRQKQSQQKCVGNPRTLATVRSFLSCQIFPFRDQTILVIITYSRSGMHGFAKGLLVVEWRACSSTDSRTRAQNTELSTRPSSFWECHSQINRLFCRIVLLPHVLISQS